MNLKESIKGNTKKFIQNVIDYLDDYCEDEQGWLDMEDNILNLRKYTRFHTLNEAIREYVMGGSLDVYYNQVNRTLNELYENTPEEAKKWEKYPDDKKWERYISIMQLYIPKAFKKKMGRDLGDRPADTIEESKSVSSFRIKSFEQAAKKFIETKDKDAYDVAKVQCHSIKESLKDSKMDESLAKIVEDFELAESEMFCNSKLEEKGLTRAERHNRDMEKIFDTKKRFQKAMSEFLKAKGVSEEEIKDLSSKDILGRKIHEMGLMDEFSKGFSFEESLSKKRSLKKIKEDYGWEVSYDNIWNLYEDMKEAFGVEELLESIVRAMGTYDLGDTLTYICRMNDYESPYLEGNEEEDEEELEEKKLHESKSDGWPDEVAEVLENVFEDSERFAYEVRNCVRGSFTGANTLEELATAAEKLGDEWKEAASELQYVDDPDIDDELEESNKKKIREALSDYVLNKDVDLKFGQYASINVDNKFTVQVKREDVGYVVDVFNIDFKDDDDLIETFTIWDDDLNGDTDEELDESKKKITERVHKIKYSDTIVGYAEPGEDESLFFMGVPCGFKTVEGEVFLDKDCPGEVYRVFPDHSLTDNSFLRNRDKADIRDEEDKEEYSYTEALNKVYSGEWTSEKFQEAVVKGIIK